MVQAHHHREQASSKQMNLCLYSPSNYIMTKLSLNFDLIKTSMASTHLTNRLLGMSACNMAATALAAIVIHGGLCFEENGSTSVTCHGGGSAL